MDEVQLIEIQRITVLDAASMKVDLRRFCRLELTHLESIVC